MRSSCLGALCALFALFSCQLEAQVAPAASGRYARIWVGAEYSNFNPDWGIPRLPGYTIFTDIALFRRYGLEGEARILNLTKPDGLTEKSFVAGPYYQAVRWHGLSANVKLLIGVGDVNYTSDIGYGSYFAYAPGAVAEYRVGRRWKARFDYEREYLPAAPNLGPGFPNHGLVPSGYSGGLAYRVF
jgi:hypothetical protein